MNNLKRVLSLGLSGVMLAGLLSVGASAADFTDAADIQHPDAVNTLVALKVINGKPDGSFAPEEDVTRSQMAKMIAVAMNGGNDTFTGTKTNPTFKDIDGHWAEAYIEYCADLDIISGRGDGTFDPDANVTGIEATKMVLTALGYNAEAYQLIGAKWASRTDQLAQAADPSLYENLAGTAMNAPASRDVAAQLIWNGLQNKTVKVTPGTSLSTGEIEWNYQTTNTKTLLEERYNGKIAYGYMTKVEYDSDTKLYTYTVTENDAFGADASEDKDISASGNVLPNNIKTDADVSHLFGQKVKVVYKGDKNETIYGIFADDSAVLTTAVVNDLPSMDVDDESVKVNGTTYGLDADANAIPVYAYNVNSRVGYLDAYETSGTKYYTIDLIDNDGNGKANCAVAHPVIAAKVTYVGKESITAGSVAYKFSESDIYEGVAKDDIVAITPKANTKNDTPVIVKAEVIEGSVDAKNNDGDVRVDDDWLSYAPTLVSGGDTAAVGDDVKFYTVNGLIVYTTVTSDSASLENVVYVVAVTGSANTASSKNLGGTLKGDDALLMFTDGTKKTVKAARVDAYSDSGRTTKANIIPGVGLYTYKVNKDGIYELKAVKADTTSSPVTVGSTFYIANAANQPNNTTSMVDVGNGSKGYDESAGKIDSKFIADDAVIFMVMTAAGKEEQKVITGKELKALDADFANASGDSVYALYKAVSGLDTIQVAALVDAAATEMPVGDDGLGYGYVISKGYGEKNADGDWLIKFTVWNEDGEVELTATDGASGDETDAVYKKGAFVSYKKSTKAGEVTDVTDIRTGNETAITGWDGSKNIALDGTASEMKDDDKTVVIYVNTADKKGVEGAEITLANKLENGSYVKNAVAVVSAGKVDVLFVDTNNDLAGASYDITAPTEWTGTVNGVTKIADNTTDSSAKAGDSVDLKLTVTAASPAASTQTKITATFTCADSTTFTAEKTLNPTAAGDITIPFTMPAKNITGITLAVTDVTPAPAG